jgi:hypothetical protein
MSKNKLRALNFAELSNKAKDLYRSGEVAPQDDYGTPLSAEEYTARVWFETVKRALSATSLNATSDSADVRTSPGKA